MSSMSVRAQSQEAVSTLMKVEFHRRPIIFFQATRLSVARKDWKLLWCEAMVLDVSKERRFFILNSKAVYREEKWVRISVGFSGLKFQTYKQIWNMNKWRYKFPVTSNDGGDEMFGFLPDFDIRQNYDDRAVSSLNHEGNSSVLLSVIHWMEPKANEYGEKGNFQGPCRESNPESPVL